MFYEFQPYDTEQKFFGVPHLFGKDENAFWKSFDWTKALTAGLQARGVAFSGSYDFVDTEYFWPITHMVAPKEKALACESCHAREGRMADVDGFYMPGRGDYPMISRIGWGVALLTLLGVIGHALLRVMFWIKER